MCRVLCDEPLLPFGQQIGSIKIVLHDNPPSSRDPSASFLPSDYPAPYTWICKSEPKLYVSVCEREGGKEAHLQRMDLIPLDRMDTLVYCKTVHLRVHICPTQRNAITGATSMFKARFGASRARALAQQVLINMPNGLMTDDD